MLTPEDSVSFISRNSIISIAHPALLILSFLLLAGCSNDGAGGPIVSSLSTPTNASTGPDSDPVSDPAVADSDQENDPIITMTSTPTGVTAHLTWDRPPDFNATGYNIYYAKRSAEEPPSEEEFGSEEPSFEESSSEEPNACSGEESPAVEYPSATITGLEPSTSYFFAIRAFNESGSLCSNEIMAVTPPAQS